MTLNLTCCAAELASLHHEAQDPQANRMPQRSELGRVEVDFGWHSLLLVFWKHARKRGVKLERAMFDASDAPSLNQSFTARLRFPGMPRRERFIGNGQGSGRGRGDGRGIKRDFCERL